MKRVGPNKFKADDAMVAAAKEREQHAVDRFEQRINDERFLVGTWISNQMAEGQTAVDLKRLADVREGIRIALDNFA